MECNKNSSLDTSILNYEKIVKKKHRHYKSKSEHRRRREDSRTKKFKTNITQKIHVERQGYKCIINLNTTICNHQTNHNIDEKQVSQCSVQASNSNVIERSVPHCLRTSCCQPRQPRKPASRSNKHHCKAHSHHHRDRDSNCLGRTRRVHNACRHVRHHEKHSKKREVQKKSEPNLPPKTKLESNYEDISSTSLDTFLEKPRTYMNATETNEKHESKLDTLIKRTKERERKLVEQSRISTRWFTSSPAYTEISSIEFPAGCSEIGLSLHSRSTLIIEPLGTGYSQSIEAFYKSPKTERILKSPAHWNFDDFEFSVKSESKVDIEAYSPMQSPEYFQEKSVKKEIKCEK